MKILFKALLLIIFILSLSGVCVAEGSEPVTLDVPAIEPCYYSGQRQYPCVPKAPLPVLSVFTSTRCVNEKQTAFATVTLNHLDYG